jgi:F0F1-type ATP synthase membrane subunit c/vacuolar-type H+-ATPase subunit K
MAQSEAGTVEAIFAPLDWVRTRTLRAAQPLSSRLAGNLELRVAVAGAVGITAAFIGALTVPMWMLALGPLVLGVPHVVADVRYLVVRRGLHRRWWIILFAGLPLLAAGLGFGIGWGILGAAGALAVARTSHLKRAIGLALVLPLAALAFYTSEWADLIFAHAHNFIAVILWWAWRRRKTKLHWIPLGIFFAATALILLGAADPALYREGTWNEPFASITLHQISWGISAGAAGDLGLRLVVLFAFAQSVHYAVWLRLVPDEDRGRPTPRTFAATFRALRADLGLWLLAATILASLAVGAWALLTDVSTARDGYLRMALFHGNLELIALALLFAEGRPTPSPQRG